MRVSSPDSLRRAPSSAILPPLPAGASLGRRVLRKALRLVQGLRRHNAFATAPAMAFHFFLSLLPMVVLLGFLLGQLVRRRGVEALLAPVLDAVPPAAEELVRGELERLAGSHAAPLAPLSILGFVWLASSGTHGLMDVFELAVGAPKRAWWRKRVMALGWVFSAIAVAASLGWGLVAVDAAVHRGDAAPSSAGDEPVTAAPPARRPSRKVDRPQDPPAAATPNGAHPRARRPLALLHAAWERVMAVGLLAAAGSAFLAAFYRFSIKHTADIQRRAWPGAFVAIIAWLVVSWAFGTYVRQLADYTLFYGSVAAVAVLLFWFYLTSWALLLGAEVNAQLEGVRDGAGR